MPNHNISIDQLKKENTELRQRIEQVEKDREEYLQNVSHQLVASLNAIK
jgi:predicted ATP-grasp superfamily ATP-dependent carboligase